MSDILGPHDGRQENTPTATSGVDLHTQLNQAYLSGNGAAVERVLALMAGAGNAGPGPGTANPATIAATIAATAEAA
jgi:hypothetical protein